MAVNILLLGRNGNGKSSTGNSILGKKDEEKVFHPRSSSQQEVEEIKMGIAEIDSEVISVVEGPGIGDTNMENPEEVDSMLKSVEKALRFCEKGFHAVVCVLKYGVRFTSQENDTVSIIRDIFGEKFFSDHGIIVMTYGDSFALDMEEEKKTFEDWCKEQTGSVTDLFKECKNRIVLFNNRAKDADSLSTQRGFLLNRITTEMKNGPYTLDKYASAKDGRKKIRIRSELPELEKKNNRKLTEITERSEEINISSNPEGSVQQLQELQKKLEAHKKDIQDISGGSDLLKIILTEIAMVEQSLKTKLARAEMLRNAKPQRQAVYTDVSKKLIEIEERELKIKACEAHKKDIQDISGNFGKMAVNILLLGRNGNGKSSTGNSILGKRVFTPRSSLQQEVEEIKMGIAEIDSEVISVVEGPGIGDTNMKNPEEVDSMLKSVEKALRFCEKGFHAVVCVLKYGVRFTSQENDTVSIIRDIFGEKFFSDHGIIVMTYGDSFALDMEEEKKTFEDWCKEQTGSEKNLFKECKNRIVLFNNRAKDADSISTQRGLLLNRITTEMKNGPYTLDKYASAKDGQKNIRIRSELPELEKKNYSKLTEITERLKEIYISSNPEGSVQQLQELQKKLEAHKKDIQDISGGSDLLKFILTDIAIVEQSLNIKLAGAEMLRNAKPQRKMYQDKPLENVYNPTVERKDSISFDETVPLTGPASEQSETRGEIRIFFTSLLVSLYESTIGRCFK